MIYFDNNATTPLDPLVFEGMRPFLVKNYANPSSLYRFAQGARRAIEEAREQVARLLEASIQEIIFTSGGTEANNLALKGIALRSCAKGRHIITSQIEHSAALEPCKFLETQGFKITYVSVDRYGLIDVDELKKNIRPDTILVSVMHANNEIGTIEPIKEIASICRNKGILLHTDAVQTVGKIPVSVKELGVDLLSLSAHKFYGPKGIGALYVRSGVKLTAIISGGHQEKGMRSGTENVAGIVGLGRAALLAREEIKNNERKVRRLRDALEKGIKDKITGVKINGHPRNRLYNTLHISIEDTATESVIINLDFKNICASGGSACMSASIEPSHVLSAIGASSSDARSALRFSLGKYNSAKDVEKTLKILPAVVDKLRKLSSSRKVNKN
ncbi:MAG: cysteine desulfurase family protein [Candidatus Omnitrophica bacterium]|nr:cysteine desulfurase family protein [Candidatus Omnitrophota bacterium]